MTQETQTPNETQTTTEPEFIPHETGMDNFDDATIETEIERSTTTQPEDDIEPQPDDETPTGEAGKPEETENTAAGNVFMYGEDAIEPGEPTQETEREKALRVELETLKKQRGGQSQQGDEPELKEPDLYDPEIGGDPQKHQAALREYFKEQGKREAQAEREQQEQEARRNAEHARIQENIKVYGQRMAEVKNTLPDIDVADDMLGRELSQLHQTALFSAGVENPELVAYALYKNKSLLDQFTKEQNPFRLGVMVANISKQARLAPKGTPKPVNAEPKVKGSQGARPNKYGLTGDFASAIIE